MKGLNFLVLQFSLLPLVTGVYKFQVLVSFPSLHWRILTRGLDQHGGVFTIYSFFGSRLYYGRTRDICGKNASKCQKKGFNLVPLSCSRDWMTFALRWANFSKGYFLCLVFCEKCPLKCLFFAWASWSILVKTESYLCKNFGTVWNCIPKPLQFFKKMP